MQSEALNNTISKAPKALASDAAAYMYVPIYKHTHHTTIVNTAFKAIQQKRQALQRGSVPQVSNAR